jgi:sugar phosphate isomerase/epimerase
LRPIITARLLRALEAAKAVGARQMVLHSPYRLWYQNNRLAVPNYAQDKLERVHMVLDPVVRRAQDSGITLVIENIEDADPATRRALVDSFESAAIALSIDTGRASGAPPVDYFVRDAGHQLAHVHLQDVGWPRRPPLGPRRRRDRMAGRLPRSG